MSLAASTSPSTLPQIPIVDVGSGGAAVLFDAAPEAARRLRRAALAPMPDWVWKMLDRAAERWLARTDNPYRQEIDAVASKFGDRGIHLLNLIYEFACATGLDATASGGARVVRTLDWPVTGVGATVMVARHQAEAGRFLNVTWPGYAGVTTAMAPGRFSAALNQAPDQGATGWTVLDKIIQARSVLARGGIPAPHLLRMAFERCSDYASAKAFLADPQHRVPTACFYALAGTEPSERCVIERLDGYAIVHEARTATAPLAVANAWLSPGLTGTPRGPAVDVVDDNRRRRAVMESTAPVADGFGWVVPPLLTPITRLAVIADAGTAALSVLGYELPSKDPVRGHLRPSRDGHAGTDDDQGPAVWGSSPRLLPVPATQPLHLQLASADS